MTRLQLRCSAEQKEAWEAAAGPGNLSSWIRDVLDREASPDKDDDAARERFEERGEATGYMAGPPLADGDEIEDSSGRTFRVYAIEPDEKGDPKVEQVEEEPDGKALGETPPPGPDAASAQVAPEGSSSTARPCPHPDDCTALGCAGVCDEPITRRLREGAPDPLGLDPGIPSTGQELREADRLLDQSPAFAEHALAAGELRSAAADLEQAEVPAPISTEALDAVIGRLFPGETPESLMSEYEGTEHDFNNFLAWLVWRHDRESEPVAPGGGAGTPSEERADVAQPGFDPGSVLPVGEDVSGDSPATCGLCGKETSVAMIAKHLEDEHGIDPREIADAPVVDNTPDHFEGNLAANIAGGRGPLQTEDLLDFDDTNPEPEDPVDLPAPTMLEADRTPTPTQQPSPTCVNAAMHWRLTAGESCRFCGGVL